MYAETCNRMQTRGNLRLPTDVMLEIMDASPSPTIASLMQTCWTLYHEGPKRILVECPHIKDSPGDALLRSFCLFLLAEHGTRFPYLRKIRFDMVAQKEDVAAMLYECIKKMTHLEVLIFDVDLDALLDCHPRYAAAFSDLRTIKRLKVAAGGPDCFAMLKNMRSQLVSVELQMWDATTTRDLTLEQDLNPVTLLEHSSGSLERLECERWYPIQFHSGNPHYPAMRRLTLDNESVPSRAALVQAYPNLTHLYFRWVDFEIPVDEDSWEVMLSDAFEANSATPFSLGWTELEEVRGTTGIIWALALRCRVRRLDLSSVRNHGDRVMLSSLLRRTHPTHLGLATAGAFFDEEIQDSMQEIFSQEGVSGLRSLDLWLDFDPDDLLDISEYMVRRCYRMCNMMLTPRACRSMCSTP